MKALVLASGASHGAFQAGALMAFDEIGYKPDIVLGCSVGAFNGAGYVSGLSGQQISELWKDLGTRDVFKWRPWREWFKVFSWNYVLDTSPLRNLIEDTLHLPSLYTADELLLVSGVDIKTGRQKIFSSRIDETINPLRSYFEVNPLDYDSILSSSAIPGIFPWVNGVWDGAFQQNNPLKPAVEMGATEIVVVHMNTVKDQTALPKGIIETAHRIIEISSSYRLVSDVDLLRKRNDLPGFRDIDSLVISPSEPLSFSRLDFDAEEKKDAINKGYDRAKQAMNNWKKGDA